jgi:Pentapeptide repeats (8 copies)
MANPEHLALLHQQATAIWNDWRMRNPGSLPDLRWANLSEANLTKAKLSGAKLIDANLYNANLDKCENLGSRPDEDPGFGLQDPCTALSAGKCAMFQSIRRRTGFWSVGSRLSAPLP